VVFFRKLLLQFVRTGRLPLNIVESEEFRALPAMGSEIERYFRGTKLGIPETRKRLDWAVTEASEVSRGLMKYRVL
jgi:hypothetical protein